MWAGWISLPHISFPGGGNSGISSGGCGAGYSKAIGDSSKCCPNGYPYYWSSDGMCHTTAPSGGGCPAGYSKAIGDSSKCCPNRYPYYWSSDGKCHTTAAGSNPSVPSASEEWYLQGIQYMNSNSYSEALECYETAIQTYSNYSDAWNGKGEALESLGRGAEALTCFQTAVQIDPQNCPAWINEGEVLESLGRNDEAMSCYNKARQIESSNEVATQNKENLLDRGIPDNAAPPPTKKYDHTHFLQAKGGGAGGGMMTIHVKEGEEFYTIFTVENGQPPYYWYLVATNGVADSISFESAENGSTVTVRGRGAYIDDPTTTQRQALVDLRVEDSSQPTRAGDPNFWVIVDNTDDDDSAIAAQVAREWYQNNYGNLNEMLQQAVAGSGYGTATVSYSNPTRRDDGYYQVTDTVTVTVTVTSEGVASPYTFLRTVF